MGTIRRIHHTAAPAGAALFLLALTLAPLLFAHAQETNKGKVEADTLKQQIESHTKQIADLDKQIAEYEKQLTVVSGEKKTLQTAVSQLNTSIKKTDTQINRTQTNISSTQLQIRELDGNIGQKETSIRSNKAGLAETMALLYESDKTPLALRFLGAGSVADLWKDAEAMVQLQGAVQGRIDLLAEERYELGELKTAAEDKRSTLESEKKKLVGQKGSLNATKQAKNELLTQTKKQESTYQKLIAEKKAAKAAFESALSNLNERLQYVVKQSDITPAGKGVLAWPVASPRVTQTFGDTDFARNGGYNGKGHNGIDLGMPTGTPLKAALGGVVAGTGNTDAIRGCYSFGKWILIKHGNGLSTLYAHLSQIGVSSGQAVETGEVIGYSGETGYATGPHLHFGVYVSSATQIMKLGDATKQKTPCAGAYMPVAPLSGYLNPLSYLP
jgi:murein DD-endopeptidase MepM/ murein hydrolase activator NlpD